ncbi:MAG: glycosyltransferase [Candidatus Omnitrophica bacterium]|nr:glycosyltransferase [Candidatus Omnitrophota bacterium]MDD5552847.1 glycosyltransferase [Candidatus Omnitrophota bacterium]
MKILFIIPYPTEGPSNRYRIEQFLPYLGERGIEYAMRPFISSKFFKILYRKGHTLKKALFFTFAFCKRLRDLASASKYDMVFVHIESFPFGPAIMEWILSKLKKPIIYDFEDAVYLENFKGDNRFVNRLRYQKRFYQIVSLSSHVIVCNRYMKELVSRSNKNVTVIPTSIDTGKFRVRDYGQDPLRPVIGWIGSHTTLYCLKSLRGVFSALAKKYDFQLLVIGGGDEFTIPGVKVVNKQWSLENDVEAFQSLDIGVYPLPNDERSMAKTPFKTIQYMSVGVPAVVSKVGGNIDIIEEGKNGFFASNEKEWIEKLSILIENPGLRRDIGLAGRRTVEERFSVSANAPKFIEVLTREYSNRRNL